MCVLKATILTRALVAAVSLAIAGGSPAAAHGKAHGKARRAAKPAAEKHACGGKNGCPAAGKADDKPAAPAAPSTGKPAETK
jgi:hypothetical protein